MTGPLDGVHVVALGERDAVRLAGGVLGQLGAEIHTCHGSADCGRLDADVLIRWKGDPGQPCVDESGLVVCDIVDEPGSWPNGARNAEASTGMMWSLHGYEQRRPVYPVLPTAALGTALLVAYAVVLGLRQGDAAVRVSTLDGSLIAQTLAAAFVASDEEPAPQRSDPLAVSTPLIRIYECADGPMLFAAPSRDAWRRTAQALDIEALHRQFPGAPWAITVAEQDALVAALSGVLAGRSRQAVVDALTGAGVSAAVVGDLRDLAQDDHVRAIGALRVAGDRYEMGAAVLTREAPSQRRAGGAPQPGLPLAGVKVVELAGFVAGPYCGACLADYGADVVKVEPPDGDPERDAGLPFEQLNRGKRSMHLDLGDPDELDELHGLITSADVFITNMRQPGLRKFGLDFESLCARPDPIVYGWVSGWGSGGPKSDLPGVDPIFQAMTGLAVAWGGYSDRLRVLSSGFLDNFTGLLCAIGIAAALRRGPAAHTYVESSLLRSAIFAQALRLEQSGVVDFGSDPVGPRALDRIYEVADGFVYLNVVSAAGWRVLAEALDLDVHQRALGESWSSPLAGVLATALRTRSPAQLASISELLPPPDAICPVRRLEELRGGRFFQRVHTALDSPVPDADVLLLRPAIKLGKS